jgi:hypothetical protein
MIRRILIPIDSVMELFKDYASANNDIPRDTVPLTLMVNPAERGMFAIRAESPSWTNDAPMRIDFDIKRVFSA